MSETTRPGLISTMRTDLPQPTHRLEPMDTLGVILFLRLKADHLCRPDMVSLESQETLLRDGQSESSTVVTKDRRSNCSA